MFRLGNALAELFQAFKLKNEASQAFANAEAKESPLVIISGKPTKFTV
jgi:hypothetical protein